MNDSQNELFNSVNFLFAKPQFQGHYIYALDDLETMSLISKDDLKSLLCKLRCGDFNKINYLLDRNLPIFFDVKEKKIKEFEINDTLTKDDINKFIKEELNENLKPKEISNYEIYFGKNSNFYKNNFIERLNIWQ